MSESKVNLKDPLVAAMLAWLVPGLGHLYQGRLFKSALYSVCILGVFFSGMQLSAGTAVHWKWDKERKTYGYLLQVLVGAPALPALVQSYRIPAPPREGGEWDRRAMHLEDKLQGPFAGTIDARFADGRTALLNVSGTIEVEETPGGGFRHPVQGRFTGRLEGPLPEGFDLPEGAAVELELSFLDSIEPPIYPSPDRSVAVDAKAGTIAGGAPLESGSTLRGAVVGARSWFNRFEAPLDETGLKIANGHLGKFLELGLVFTWIAGLLNLLAVWDAAEGPAYGYGNEQEHTQNQPTAVASTPSISSSAATMPLSVPTPAAPSGKG